MILYALNKHDDHDIDQFVKKKTCILNFLCIEVNLNQTIFKTRNR